MYVGALTALLDMDFKVVEGLITQQYRGKDKLIASNLHALKTGYEEAQAAFATAREMMAEYRVPVVVEFILERVTNIAMGTEIDKINEFEAIDCRHPEGTQGLELAGLLD